MKEIIKFITLCIQKGQLAFSRFVMHLFKTRFRRCGAQVIFDPLTSTLSYDSIEIGSFVFIGHGATMSSSKEYPIEIGSYVMLGPNVSIYCGDHEMNQIGKPMYFMNKDKQSTRSGKVIIKDDVWIGANATILKGVTVGEGVVIAAGSIVTKSIPDYSIVAGIPAKVIKQRFSKEELHQHKKMVAEWSVS
ncbi:acyltransferase [Legionella sp. WA2024007413]